MMPSPDILLAEYEDIIEQGVTRILHQHESALPDLSRLTVFVPGSQLPTRFRRCLLDQLQAAGHGAVIPPWLGTFEQWINENIPLPDAGRTVITEQARCLLFIDALNEHPGLFSGGNQWQLTRALLSLFDELALNDVSTVEASSVEWQQCIASAYRSSEQETLSHRHLQKEAEIVHTLWRAWREELDERMLLDGTGAYIERLRRAPSYIPADERFYLLAGTPMSRTETTIIEVLQAREQCTVIASESTSAIETTANQRQPLYEFIHSVYDYQSMPLRERASRFAANAGAFEPPFSIFYSDSAEAEARAVELQTRLWLLEGRSDIGIVSEDRRLSRRVRALLERADVFIQDAAGWSLSTTSASAVLERWLECIEQDFDYRPMLDLLKSHFIDSGLERETHLQAVYRLEHDIILHENIGHGLTRYRNQMKYRLHRLEHWPEKTYDHVLQLLQQLEAASHYLLQLYRAEKAVPLAGFLEAFETSLSQLGLTQSFANDAAGKLVLATLQQMKTGFDHASPKMHWRDFRTWLGMTLEDSLFSPQNEDSPVRLMTLQQAEHQRFDALIIAAADRQHLPGKAAASPFFNQSVRRSLGLGDWEQEREQRLAQFKRLLLSSDDILITCKREENGEPAPLSPWIEALQHFYQQSMASVGQAGMTLENRTLPGLLETDSAVFICDTTELPPIPARPAPPMPAQIMPPRISASAHQRLINCPYQYFAGYALGLKAPDEIREELQKSDYGERVHRILNAFHTHVAHLPEPFTAKLSSENRQTAIDHMASLSAAVFKQDLEDNALHRSWLHRWLQHIPAYIDWQIEQQQQWRIHATEQNCETALPGADVALYGRIDRIDADGDDRCIIDYKTGSTPRQADVDSGEDVQLASYALLDEHTRRVMYLALDNSDGKVRTAASLQDEQLLELRTATADRLRDIVRMQKQGHAMPAWGDATSCGYCDFAGLCRRQIWEAEIDMPAAAQDRG